MADKFRHSTRQLVAVQDTRYVHNELPCFFKKKIYWNQQKIIIYRKQKNRSNTLNLIIVLENICAWLSLVSVVILYQAIYLSLSSKLTSCFQAISNQISTLDNNLSDKLDKVKKSLYIEIRKAENKAQQALDLAMSNESALKSMQLEMFDLKRRYNGLFEENIILQKQCDAQETYSRRNNLMIRGIPGKTRRPKRCVSQQWETF